MNNPFVCIHCFRILKDYVALGIARSFKPYFDMSTFDPEIDPDEGTLLTEIMAITVCANSITEKMKSKINMLSLLHEKCFTQWNNVTNNSL